jgi:hypothetical protein
MELPYMELPYTEPRFGKFVAYWGATPPAPVLLEMRGRIVGIED